MRNEIKRYSGMAFSVAIGASAAALMAACGGSGDDDSSLPRLGGTQGNAASSLGVWRTECGTTLDGTQLRGIKLVLNVTSAAGSTAVGRLNTSTNFTQTACTDGSATLSVTNADVTLVVDPIPVAVTGDAFVGSADRVTISAPGAAASTNYFGFKADMSGLYISASTSFSALGLLYTKQAP